MNAFTLIMILIAPFIGSFLGVLILRLPKCQPVGFSRSACPQCGHILQISDLVPLFSWLWTKARCRYCQKPIPRFYPFIELAALVIALWAALITSGWVLVASCLLGWLLLCLAVIDWRDFILPDILTLPLLLTGLIFAALMDLSSLLSHVIGAAAGFAIFALIALIYKSWRHRDGLGLGDAKLLAAMGAWLTWQGLPSVILIASLFGIMLALSQFFAGKNLTFTTKLPFGSCLCLSAWIVWLYGPIVF